MREYQADTINTYNKIAREYHVKRKGAAPMQEIEAFIKLLGGKKVLDAGTGPGRDARIIAEKGFDVSGVDLSEEFISLALTEAINVEFIVMDILNLQFETNYFDGIWCCAVLSHFKKEDIPLALFQLNRVLKPGGILFTAVREGSGEEVVLESEFFNYPRFFSYFSGLEFATCLEKSNFEVINYYTYNERERFGRPYRDVNFIFTFSRKKENNIFLP